jgi:hypothetical protein
MYGWGNSTITQKQINLHELCGVIWYLRNVKESLQNFMSRPVRAGGGSLVLAEMFVQRGRVYMYRNRIN